MATAVLSTAGNAIAPGIGGIIGGIVGGFIDNAITSAFNKSTPIEGPRLDDLRLQLRSEGSPLLRVHGRRVRIAGVVIWGPPLIEEINVTTSGGGGAKGGGGAPETTRRDFVYYLNNGVKLADTRHLPNGQASALKKLWANNILIFDADADDSDDSSYTDLRFFNGASSQMPDSLIVATEGADTPAYRGSCGFVIERLLMDEFGTSVNFEALLEPEATAPTVGTVIARELELGGLTSDQYDVSGISASKTVEGLPVSGLQDPASVIAALQTAYNIVHSEWGGKIRFIDRGNERTVGVTDSDFLDDRSGPSPVKRKKADERDLPNYVHVSFFEASCDYQQSSRTANAQGYRGQGSEDKSMPLVLTGEEASTIAHQAIWTGRGSLVGWEARLPPSFSDLSENEILLWTDKTGRQKRMRTLDVNIGADHTVRASGVIEQAGTFDQSDYAIADDRTCDAGDSPFDFGDGLNYIFFNQAPLSDKHLRIPGVYRAWGDTKNRFNAQRRALFSYDDGAYQNQGIGIRYPTIYAELNDDMPAVDEKSMGGQLFDEAATVRVTLISTETNTYVNEYAFQTRDRDDVRAGQNWLFVMTDDGGQEVFAYHTATDLGNGQYRLTGLLRGLRGTENHAREGSTSGLALASVNEMLAPPRNDGPEDGWLKFPDYTAQTYDNVKAKATMGTEDVATKPAQDLGAPGSLCVPLSPTNLEGRRNDDGDLLIACRRRPRAIWDGFLKREAYGGWYPNVDPPSEVSTVFDVYYGGDLKRTIEDPMTVTSSLASDFQYSIHVDWTSVSTLRSTGHLAAKYTAAMHVEDGVPLHATVTIKARQINGFGESADAELTV